MIPRLVTWMHWAGAMALGASAACGQDFPIKPVRIIASEAAGAGDFAARLIAQGLITGW